MIMDDEMRDKFDEWGKRRSFGIRAAMNIKAECFLPVDRRVAILEELRPKDPCDVPAFEKAYEEACYKHVKQGGPIKPPPPARLGTALEVKTFRTWAMKSGNLKSIEWDGLKHRLANGGSLVGKEKMIKLKEYTVWATWNSADSATDPFSFNTSGEANEVRANLGLPRKGWRGPRGQLMLLTYELPTTLKALCPTFADANLNEYWAPPPSAEIGYGLTVNWPKDETTEQYTIEPRPETVHDAVELADIHLPVRIR